MGSGSSFLEMWAGEDNGLLSVDTVKKTSDCKQITGCMVQRQVNSMDWNVMTLGTLTV